MAPVEAVIGSWGAPWSSSLEVAVFSLFVLLLLCFIFLALCAYCERNSFELRDTIAERSQSTLIRMVRLEDAQAARENPMINEITRDEKDPGPMFQRQATSSPGQNHSSKAQWSPTPAPDPHQPDLNGLKVGQSRREYPVPESPPLDTSSVNSLQILSAPKGFRSPSPDRDQALAEDEKQDPWPALEASIQHIYDTIGEPRADRGADGVTAGDMCVPGQNCNPWGLSNEGLDSLAPLPVVEVEVEEEEGGCDKGWNPMYARISKKVQCPTPPPVPPPDEDEDEEVEESPPLPSRSFKEEN